MAPKKLLPDAFTLSLLGTVALASILPVHGPFVASFNLLTNIAVGLLFFLHGAKLSREAIVAGATHWRLHITVLLSTFAVFPLVGLLLKPIMSPLVTAQLYTGVLFLCTLPSTVPSSIAFTSIARGNVSAAVCSASASSLLGIFITPALVGLLLTNNSGSGVSPWHTVWNIVLQLLVPFIAGQLLRPVIGTWVDRNKSTLKFVDQGSILLVVYGAFSEALMEGLWHRIPLAALAGVLVVCTVILCTSLLITILASRCLRFNREDQITIVFCGSKKSLAAGIPMANVIFSASSVGAVVLPLMLFHQIQLMVCSALAQRWASRWKDNERQSLREVV
ncbi:bile acid:sodium symporter [Caballeronia arvi]|uniref:Bile acid:sodium symporter n=1 Tax=Caballeronia arvi TaxID=1777135 RepID=A0A158JTK9_9BURK|nr:bile acid:sodium symporter family protein [Caballeronia arvi]SAL71761.1 bile acid:sodium symporter [Caballeronia arvi]